MRPPEPSAGANASTAFFTMFTIIWRKRLRSAYTSPWCMSQTRFSEMSEGTPLRWQTLSRSSCTENCSGCESCSDVNLRYESTNSISPVDVSWIAFMPSYIGEDATALSLMKTSVSEMTGAMPFMISCVRMRVSFSHDCTSIS